MAKVSAEKAEAIADLRKYVRPGDTLYTILRSRSRSGMSRTLDVYVIKRNEPLRLTWAVARACGFRYDRRREALVVGGCGFDAGFEVVQHVSYALHGFKPRGDGAKPENAGHPFEPRPGHYRAGYSLKHRWIG